MRILKLLSDWILVEEEPAKTATSGGIIIPIPENAPIRIGRALMVGPGRRYKDKFVPMQDGIVGERLIFLAAASDTKQGEQLKTKLNDKQRLIRLGDVLGIVSGATEISL